MEWSSYMQSNPRIPVNLLVILVNILVNLLVKLTKLANLPVKHTSKKKRLVAVAAWASQ